MNFRDHPAIEFPEWLRKLGFQDLSWKNDACARAGLRLEREPIGGTVRWLTVWVNHPDPKNRELGSLYGVIVERATPDGAYTGAPEQTLYEGDDASEAEHAVRNTIVRYR